ncbi:hypothetical protein BZA70DRAFT_10070 [Myxozyma melibiosi]|uniref:ML-like domain-containing protein n=1 Tax=Myxozyma melibiosi TaxID=54550 RepID=A0ABR1FBW1_9ASCO
MRFTLLSAATALAALSSTALAANTIGTDSFYTCNDGNNATISVSTFSVSYSKTTQNVTFDLAGSSTEAQNVSATIYISAYGIDVFSYSFDFCDEGIEELCPVPEGSFSASGEVNIPTKYASQIPSIAFSIPDLDGEAKLELNNTDTGDSSACFQSSISNGKTAKIEAVTYASAAIAAGALVVSGISSLASAAGSTASAVGFADIMSWTQFMATSGMMSVTYPAVYSSFSQNFGWSSALISWKGMQTTIDSMRSKTGGNTTYSSWDTTQSTTVLNYKSGALILLNDSSTSSDDDETSSALRLVRRLTVDGIDLNSSNSTTSDDGSVTVLAKVAGIARFVENLMLPNANAFMTVLLFFAMIMAAIIVAILAFRIIIEIVAYSRDLPKALENFRHRYWTVLATTLIRVIMILYGTWVLFCLYQFKLGDSWASLVLAGVTLGLFSVILLGFTIRIFVLARRASKSDEGLDELYDHKPWIRRYGLFYGQFKTKYWWFFIPVIGVAVGRSAFIALADGHGMVQVIGQLVLEVLFVFALLILRPFNRRSGNVINVFISVVRTVSLICVLVFVEELGVAAETTTIVGVVLIIVQAVLTLLLVLLLVIQAILGLCTQNKRDQKRGVSDDDSDLVPLDDLKADIAKTGFDQSLYSFDQKSTSGLEAIGLAVSEYDPLYPSNGGGLKHSATDASLPRHNPWDEDRLQPEVVPLTKRSGSVSSSTSERTTDEAGYSSWAKGGLERDSNGRPMF